MRFSIEELELLLEGLGWKCDQDENICNCSFEDCAGCTVDALKTRLNKAIARKEARA